MNVFKFAEFLDHVSIDYVWIELLMLKGDWWYSAQYLEPHNFFKESMEYLQQIMDCSFVNVVAIIT